MFGQILMRGTLLTAPKQFSRQMAHVIETCSAFMRQPYGDIEDLDLPLAAVAAKAREQDIRPVRATYGSMAYG